jgi:hypothetical protein
MLVIAANFIAKRIEHQRRVSRAEAAAAAAAEAGEDAEMQEIAYQRALNDGTYTVPRYALFLFVFMPWLLCFLFLPMGRYVDIVHASVKPFLVDIKGSATSLRRHAVLISGSACGAPASVPSHQRLFGDTDSGFDIFAVLTSSNDSACDAAAFEWLSNEPDVRLVRILGLNETMSTSASEEAVQFLHKQKISSAEKIFSVVSHLAVWHDAARLIAEKARIQGHKYHTLSHISTNFVVETDFRINLDTVMANPGVAPVQITALRASGVSAQGQHSELSIFGPNAGNTRESYNSAFFFGQAGLIHRILDRALPSLDALMLSGVHFDVGTVLHAVTERVARQLGSNAAGPLSLRRYEVPVILHHTDPLE